MKRRTEKKGGEGLGSVATFRTCLPIAAVIQWSHSGLMLTAAILVPTGRRSSVTVSICCQARLLHETRRKKTPPRKVHGKTYLYCQHATPGHAGETNRVTCLCGETRLSFRAQSNEARSDPRLTTLVADEKMRSKPSDGIIAGSALQSSKGIAA